MPCVSGVMKPATIASIQSRDARAPRNCDIDAGHVRHIDVVKPCAEHVLETDGTYPRHDSVEIDLRVGSVADLGTNGSRDRKTCISTPRSIA